MVNLVCALLTIFNTVFQLASYVPQFIKLIKRKTSDDISVLSIVTYIVSGISYFTLLILTRASFYLFILQGLVIFLDISTLILVLKYRTKPLKNRSS